MSYQLSPDQIAALQAIGRWYRTKSSPYLTLGGYAGTGKTTLLAYVRQALYQNDPDTKVAFCAFTGKAVRVLERTLAAHHANRRGDSVTTIHGLIYNTELDAAGHVTGWRRRTTVKASLIIIDEASMVTAELWQDLLSFEVPILAVGDHGQLPPIGDQFNLMAEPMLRLEQVYRQADTSPIIKVATLARTTGQIPAGDYGDGVVKYDRASDDIGVAMEELLEQWRPEWLVLCGYNHTRLKLNGSLRQRLGFESPDPVAGDHVICLRNNATAKLYNGMTGTIDWIEPAAGDPDQLWWQAGLQLDDRSYEGYLLRAQFDVRETVSPVPPLPDALARRQRRASTAGSKTTAKARGDLFDFGYALTVHKAQGSSADTVLLFEERSRHMSDDDWRRWLYTAVTRAERRLYVIGD